LKRNWVFAFAPPAPIIMHALTGSPENQMSLKRIFAMASAMFMVTAAISPAIAQTSKGIVTRHRARQELGCYSCSKGHGNV
jgi:hypothetical protein